MSSNGIPMTDWTKEPISTPDGRIAMAGAFWERGEPLTDEVWATKEYLMRKFGRTDVPMPIHFWNMKPAKEGEAHER